MIRDIQKISLLDVLPPSILNDKKINAAAQALDVELQKLSGVVPEVLHIPRLDELPEKVLDLLAWHYHCDFYEPVGMSIETKRNLIRESIAWHRIKGTPAAVEKLARIVFKDAHVEEWFEYDGEPYRFKVAAKGLSYTGDEAATFFRMVEAAKNERSWLDNILFDLSEEHPDTILYSAFGELQKRESKSEISNPEGENYSLTIPIAEMHRGDISTEFDLAPAPSPYTVFAGFGECHGGKITTSADLDDSELQIPFKEFLWRNWIRWKNRAIIKNYPHYDFSWREPLLGNTYSGFGEAWGGRITVSTDLLRDYDPDWDFHKIPEEEYPDGEFLRLYFGFPDYSVKTITLMNPKENLTGADIHFVSDLAKKYKLIYNRKGVASYGIRRALYVTKHFERVY